MKLPNFTKRLITDIATQGFQESVYNALAAVFGNPIISGVIINNVFLDHNLGVVTINHGLGVTPQGWVIIDKNKNSDFWKTASTDKVLTLTSDAIANTTFSIYIF